MLEKLVCLCLCVYVCVCDALMNEIWAKLHGLELAWPKQFTNLMVASDSKILIDMVSQKSLEDNFNLNL